MSLIVEDGTGMIDSNAYVSIAEADSYFGLRGNALWGGLSDAEKEAAIVDGTDYIGIRWPCFRGKLLHDFQALPFPRDEWEGIPVALKRACMEYAAMSAEDSLWLRPSVDSSGLAVAERTEKVGPIEERIKYGVNSTTGVGTYMKFAPIPKADSLMRPFICNEQGRVIRA